MKKNILLFILFLSISLDSIAQNLVPNPSLEVNITCPVMFSELPFPSGSAISVTDWYRPSDATSDYFHSCSTSGMMGGIVATPSNFAGYQPPKTGEAYGGGYCFLGATAEYDYREYLQSHLSSPLIAGHEYFVSYYTSLGEGMAPLISVDQMGAYFSVDPEERIGVINALTDLVPQVASPFGVLLNDTVNWMNISGTFTASGGEEWMIIGNFTPLDDLSTSPVGTGGEYGTGYYYYDDFCVLDLTAPSITSNSDVIFCPGAEILIKGQDDFSTYIWDDGTTTQNRAITETGTYWVNSIDLATCTNRLDTINAVISIEPLLIDLGNDTVVCKSTSIELNAFDNAFTTYRWSTGEHTPSISAAYPGIYYVTAESDCYTGTDTIVITAPAMPRVELPADAILCTGKEMSIGVVMGNLQYQWNTGENKCCINVTEPGNYILTATNICGESDTDEIEVNYSECDNCILAPTAFTPNGDGLNDQYKVTVRCTMKNYALKIFNRWGQMVFITTNVDDGWDGTFNGTPAELGVYFYYVEGVPMIEAIGELHEKGDITLIR